MRKNLKKKNVEKKRKPRIKNTWLIFLAITLFFSMVLVLYQAQQIQELRGNAQNANCIVPAEELTLDTEEKVLFDKINTYRQQQGKTQLKLSPSLLRAAAWMSADMNTNKRLNHTDSLGGTMQTRLSNCGYPGALTGGSENIASTGPTAEQVFNAWKNSTQGHNENLLNERWTVMAVARNGNYWTFNAGQTDDSNTPTNPPGQVPSPVCGGSGQGSVCPSPSSPSTVPSTPQPTSQEEPTIALQPSVEPDAPDLGPSETPPTNPDEKKGQRSNTGIIGLFLQFLISLLELFRSLFGRN